MPRSDGLPVLMWEIDDITEGEFFQLKDGDLPEQGVQWGGKQRLVKTHYPGATKASVQVLGTEEDDVLMKGWLRDSWAGREGHALEMRAKIERIRHRQRYCELAWGEDFTVRGFLKEARFIVHRETDIEYELVFDVVEASQAEVIAVKPVPAASEADLVRTFDATLAEIEEGLRIVGDGTQELGGVLTVLQALVR